MVFAPFFDFLWFVSLRIVHDFLNRRLYEFAGRFIEMMVSGPMVPVFQAPADAFIDELFKGFKVFEIVHTKFALITQLVLDVLINQFFSINFEIFLSDLIDVCQLVLVTVVLTGSVGIVPE